MGGLLLLSRILWVEFIYKSVKSVIQYFCFLDRSRKGGDILDFWKGGSLRKGGGGRTPLTNYGTISSY